MVKDSSNLIPYLESTTSFVKVDFQPKTTPPPPGKSPSLSPPAGDQNLEGNALAPSASGKKRGFASMDPERQREIASMGGRAIKPEKRSFSQNKALARSAGKKGGLSAKALLKEK